jgi:hypothetical protein
MSIDSQTLLFEWGSMLFNQAKRIPQSAKHILPRAAEKYHIGSTLGNFST